MHWAEIRRAASAAIVRFGVASGLKPDVETRNDLAIMLGAEQDLSGFVVQPAQ